MTAAPIRRSAGTTSIGSDLRRGGPHGILDGQFQRHRRRRTALAAARKCQPHNTVCDVKQLDVTAVRPEVGPYRVQRVRRRGGHVVRMQAVHQQQAGDQVVGRPARSASAGSTSRTTLVSAGPVQIDDLAYQLLGARSRRPARRLRWRRAAPGSAHLPMRQCDRRIGVRPCVTPRSATGSGSAACPATCPRPGTCALRTAGRGRSCAPCA